MCEGSMKLSYLITWLLMGVDLGLVLALIITEIDKYFSKGDS
jgi:hypothetical protein